MKRHWSEDFEGLLNVFDNREADVGCLGSGSIQSVRVTVSGLTVLND